MVERLWQFTSKNSHDFVSPRLIMPDNYALVCGNTTKRNPDE